MVAVDHSGQPACKGDELIQSTRNHGLLGGPIIFSANAWGVGYLQGTLTFLDL